MAKEGSMLNTPPTFGLVHRGPRVPVAEEAGRPGVVAERNRQGRALYAAIDGSGYYRNPVAPAHAVPG
jgi:phosphoserine aminotransferase